MTYKYIDL